MKKEQFLLFVAGVVVLAALILRVIQLGNDKGPALVVNQEPSSSVPIEIKTPSEINEPLVGNDRDEHGCIGSAGYSWCETKQKCLRIWEEDCPLVIDSNNINSDKIETIEVAISNPLPGDLVISPLTVVGKALGAWFFEASLPVSLLVEDGSVIISHYGQAESDWMTSDFVPFSSELVFKTDASSGYLVIAKDNPSGLPENDEKIVIPVKFK